MNNLIKPFYVYSCYYTRNGALSKYSSNIISHSLEDLDNTIFTLPDASFEVSRNIRSDYNLQLFAYRTIYTICSVNLIHDATLNVVKLNFEEFNVFYNKYQLLKSDILFNLLGASCHGEIDNLLDLMMLNWDEWN